MDEFAEFFAGTETPKILITSSRRPSKKTDAFCSEAADIFPNCQYVPRPLSHLVKDVCRDALEEQFTHVIVISENQKLPETLILTKLPHGPTAYFHLSSIKPGKEIYKHGRSSAHSPELILNNFTTRLGHTIGRFFVSLFPPIPQFHGRQVVTFHNQRDFIFFRRHRYIFDDQGQRVTLQEIGPRFTLKLEALQKGIFDRQEGHFELSHRAADQAARKRSFIL
jgi:ribosome production factor 1